MSKWIYQIVSYNNVYVLSLTSIKHVRDGSMIVGYYYDGSLSVLWSSILDILEELNAR